MQSFLQFDIWKPGERDFVFPGSLVNWDGLGFRLLVVLFPSLQQKPGNMAPRRHTEMSPEGTEPVLMPTWLNWANFCNYNRKTVVHLGRSESLHLRGEPREF